MAIEHEGKCADCDSRVPDREVRLIAIGERVHLSGDKIVGDTEYNYFQCPTCGLLWTTYRDYGGAAGNDTFHKLLTDGL